MIEWDRNKFRGYRFFQTGGAYLFDVSKVDPDAVLGYDGHIKCHFKVPRENFVFVCLERPIAWSEGFRALAPEGKVILFADILLLDRPEGTVRRLV